MATASASRPQEFSETTEGNKARLQINGLLVAALASLVLGLPACRGPAESEGDVLAAIDAFNQLRRLGISDP
jgi:hypothetical protein